MLEMPDNEDSQFIRAWKSDEKSNSELLSSETLPQMVSQPYVSVFQPLFKKISQHSCVASCGQSVAYCAFNSKVIQFRQFANDQTFKQSIDLEHFTSLKEHQGITALAFATPTLLLAASMQSVFVVPITPKIHSMAQVMFLSNATKNLRFDQKRTPANEVLDRFSMRQVVTKIACNKRLCAVAFEHKVYVVSLQTLQTIQILEFAQNINCLDVNEGDFLAVGLTKSLEVKNLATGQAFSFAVEKPVQSIQFQKFSQQVQKQSQNKMSASKSSFLQQSLLEQIQLKKASNNLKENSLVFCLQNDITAFLLNCDSAKLQKAFEFSPILINEQQFGGKLLEMKFQDGLLLSKFQNNCVLGMLFEGNYCTIGCVNACGEDSQVAVAGVVTVVDQGIARVWGV